MAAPLSSLPGMPPPPAWSAQAAPEEPAQCVAVRSEEQQDGMRYALSNGCGKPLSCQIRWRLTCEEEGSTPESRQVASGLVLAADEAEEVAASAEACGGRSWRIDQVTWSCHA